MTIRGHEDLRKAYEDDRVAREYVHRRFTSPIGALLHARQVAAVHRTLSGAQVRRALEIAPGPARVTVDVAPALEQLTLIDASQQMLAEARTRLRARGLQGRVQLVRADAFRLPACAAFDLVYSFRLIRHFERDDRLRLYDQIARVLRPGGWLVFDAVNAAVSAPLRARARPGEYQHFDALLTEKDVREELEAGGFRQISLQGVQRRYGALRACQIYLAPRSAVLARAAMELIDRSGGEPLEWVVTCRRA
jgi:ubiquinone/menaquinone biosynthesis C-methylase UbiE